MCSSCLTFVCIECHRFVAQTLPCASSVVAERVRACCAFKDAYYAALSVYFQGAACMAKDNDAAACALAIADLKRAQLLLGDATRGKAAYDAALDKGKDGDSLRARRDVLDAIYLRSQQIVQRDLDIMTKRNDSVYYERVRGASRYAWG